MSRLEELIQTLCPDGVEFKKLGQVCKFIKGKGLSKDAKGQGDVPIILYGELYTTYGNYISYIVSHTSIDLVNSSPIVNKGDLVLPVSSTTKEAQIGKASAYMVEEPAYLGGDAILLKHKQNPGFLTYLLNGNWFEAYKMKCVFGTTINHLHPSKLSNIFIPVPPLAVQEEIVRILDTFTTLETELDAELAARTKQYEHYRNELLSFNSGSKIMDNLLADCCPDGVKYFELQQIFDFRNGYTPSRKDDKNWSGGNISWFTLKDLRKNGGLLSDSIEKITPQGVKRDLFEANSIIISTLATIGEHALILNNALANQQMTCLTRKEEFKSLLDPKFIYYYCFLLGQWCKENVNVSGFASVDMGRFAKFKFPVPPLEVQEKVVSILDRFDTLVNDLKSGLPAEIALRRKQYEYYRNKLLTFKPIQPPL